MQPTQYTLPNGLQVVLLEHHVAPVVAMEVWVGAGSADERPDQAGLAHVHEHMLFKGTLERGVGEVAREVEAAGGEINARTSFDYTVYHVEMSSRFFEQGLEILGDAVQNPAFDPEELRRELDVIVEELKRAHDSPGYKASQQLFANAFSTHPYRNPVIGTAESVQSFGREDVLEFFNQWYVPANMTLVIVGDIEEGGARKEVTRVFGGSERAAPVRRARESEPEQNELRVEIVHGDRRESHLQIAFHIPALTHNDVPALDVLSVLLGAGGSSRLEQTLRRREGLVSSVGCFAYTPRDPGIFTVGATFQDQEGVGFERVLRRLLGVVGELGAGGPSAEEVERARTLIASQTVYQKQTMRGLAQKFGYYLCTAGSLEAEASYYDAIGSVSVADIRRVAGKYLQPDNMTLVLETSSGAEPGRFTEAEVERIAREALEVRGEPDQVESSAAIRPVQPVSEFDLPPGLQVSPADDYGISRVVFPSGLRLLVQQDDTIPLISVWTSVPGGKRYENDETSGASHLLSELLTLGTENRSAVRIAEDIERLGGAISGYAGNNTVGLSSTFLSEHLEEGFELFADCLLNPELLDEEIERERDLVLQSLRTQDDHVASVAFRTMVRELYGTHPYRLQLAGSEKSVTGLTRAQLQAMHEQAIASDQRVVGVVGDISPEQAARQVAHRLPLATDAIHLANVDPPVPPAKTTVHLRHKEKEQAHLVLGFMGTTLDAKDRYALEVLSAVLSGQGGRLFLEIRDKQGLAYSVSAIHRPDQDRGFFAFYVATSPDKLEKAAAGIGAEIQRLLQEPVSDLELARARRYLIGSHDVSLQRASTRASSMSLYELYGLGYDHHLHFGEIMMGISAADVQEAAQRYFKLNRAVISAVLPEGVDLDATAFGL